MSNYWNKIDLSEIDTPALLIDKDMVDYNIQQAIIYAQGVDYFRPHVKTHKMLEVAKMQMEAGIYKFKCATIAEAEMLGMAGAKDVLIAYSLQGPKIGRYLQLIEKYPNTNFASIVDEANNIQLLNDTFALADETAQVYIDINNGNNRTGITVKQAEVLSELIIKLENIELKGIHCYDGHITMSSLTERIKKAMKAFNDVEQFNEYLELKTGRKQTIVAGGSPTFSVHSRFHDVESSPGTWIFWDERYSQKYKEQAFNKAAVLATRVVSQIDKHHFCLDLGHKSVASENPLPRVEFTTSIKEKQVSQSEEHLVIKCKHKNELEVGQVLTAFPYHICPTVACYQKAYVVKDGVVVDEWEVTARNRQITV
ncbi:D-TA family PLP-dependent enzyme [Portibacter lacus]|uniref:Threonine aldolase n=1 Tax=Portibacter lacus TaxID=1099794 RepID=A0AA37SPF8_9BACT|nr:D-TA family PLP-dependent enzyme [Portibacter lacus]GLR17329.1 threonine aldolase [Portibacter lacus]